MLALIKNEEVVHKSANLATHCKSHRSNLEFLGFFLVVHSDQQNHERHACRGSCYADQQLASAANIENRFAKVVVTVNGVN